MADELVQAKLSFTMPIRGTTVSVNAPPLTVKDKVPTFSLVPASTSVNEGSTFWITLFTSNIPRDGSVKVRWWLDWLNGSGANDVVGGAGNPYVVYLASDGTHRMGWDIIADNLTEGTESFNVRCQVFRESDNYQYADLSLNGIYVNDTSKNSVNYYNLSNIKDDKSQILRYSRYDSYPSYHNDDGGTIWVGGNDSAYGSLDPQSVVLAGNTYTIDYMTIISSLNNTGEYYSYISLLLKGDNPAQLAKLNKSTVSIVINGMEIPLFCYMTLQNGDIYKGFSNTDRVAVMDSGGATVPFPSNASWLNIPASGSMLFKYTG